MTNDDHGRGNKAQRRELSKLVVLFHAALNSITISPPLIVH
jgi:hypothetical protein